MSIQIIPLINKYSDGQCRRSCKIIGLDGKKNEKEVDLWFQFDESITSPNYDNCDAYLLAIILDAMRQRENIEVKGTVSKQLLSNLAEYQEARNKWYPNEYHKVDIIVDDIRDDESGIPGAVCAFSGGVDSTFSVWRHVKNKCGYRSQNINMCVLVHGFDIAIDDEVAFKNSYNKSINVLNDVDIPLVTIKTNYREISKNNWEHSYCCALVATLSNFKRHAGTCIVGSGRPYDYLKLPPMGSSPYMDYLLSSDEFSVMHDGASHSRAEKIKEIADWKVGTDNLRVCWQCDTKNGNCGICEKCVRTKVIFLAANLSIPSCFPKSDVVQDLKNIGLIRDPLRPEWQQIYDYAKANNADGPWLKEVRALIRRKPAEEVLFPKGSKRRQMVKDLITLYRHERQGVDKWLSQQR